MSTFITLSWFQKAKKPQNRSSVAYGPILQGFHHSAMNVSSLLYLALVFRKAKSIESHHPGHLSMGSPTCMGIRKEGFLTLLFQSMYKPFSSFPLYLGLSAGYSVFLSNFFREVTSTILYHTSGGRGMQLQVLCEHWRNQS